MLAFCQISKNFDSTFWDKWKSILRIISHLWKKAIPRKGIWLLKQKIVRTRKKSRMKKSSGWTLRSWKDLLFWSITKNIWIKVITKRVSKFNITTTNNGSGCNFPGCAKQSKMYTQTCSNNVYQVQFTSCLQPDSSISLDKSSKLLEQPNRANYAYTLISSYRFCP